MATINLRGYDVNFPYPVPYDLQKVYMEKVLTCLDEKTHAVLESPTGTGKTLCLFAPVVAWAKRIKQQVHFVTNDPQQKEFRSAGFDSKDQHQNWGEKGRTRIWYTTRTHAQIAQTIAEVRKCNTEGLVVRVMGARDQLCINKAVTEEKDSFVKTVRCKELIKNNQCGYYNRLNHEKDYNSYYQEGKVLDIEDLISVGKGCGVCPFFLAKKGCDTADIVLLPYNYIIDAEAREGLHIVLQNDVVIFDEGHNIPSTCEECFEFGLSSLDIAVGIRNIKDLMHSLTSLAENKTDDDSIDFPAHVSNSMLIMTALQRLESEFEELPIPNTLLPVSALHSLLENAGLNKEASRELIGGFQKFKSDSNKLALSGSTLETFKLLEKVLTVTFGSTVRSFDQSTVDRSFKCGVVVDAEGRKKVKTFCLYCFNPTFGIKTLLQMGVQSIIITSGTLSPIPTFVAELGLPKPITLENGHIAKKCQVPFVILGTGVNSVRLDGSYKNRNDPKYISSLGMTLTNLIASIPDGVLLLFSSYTMMQNLKEAWESDLGIWTRLNALKRVFIEPRSKEEFINCMENYRRAIDSGNGAILMGVLRGKISEGMDFKDQYCRGVFIIGVPFPPVQDPRVKGKEKYADSLYTFNPETNREEKLYKIPFVSVEAMRATNQAIGRVIRHKEDYGIIFLVDYRFALPRLFTNVSRWLRGDVPVESNFPMSKKLVREFFKNVYEGKLGFKEIRCQRVDSNGCPVASYVSYEEYDHKKHAPQHVSWIGEGESQKSKSRVRKPRGHAKIEYVNEEFSRDLVSMYKNVSTETVEGNADESSNPGSLLDALESSRSNGVGYKEFDKNSSQQSESSKRKYQEEEEEDSSQSSFQSSPSLLSFPGSSQKQKKVPRLKVRPLIPSDAGEIESQNAVYNTTVKPETKTDEDLKIKLINYYRKVKRTLSEEHDQKFKSISCKYMKGEATLAEVINSMDELFLSPGNDNLFSGFGICVKVKDKEEWRSACKSRKLQSP